ncbi:UMP kinase [Candidatus Woesearchaeota archaeon]|nr:UMP kinase [Candidatus Woesearchaeota archaeon]
MKTIVFSLGGSIIIPKEINLNFLKEFHKLVLSIVKRGNRVVIVCGGGSINTRYNAAVRNVNPKASSEDLDWLGIACTKINAFFVKALFGDKAYGVIDDPTKKIKTNKKILIASGWKPGFSSDNDAVLLGKNLDSRLVVNLTNISHVYDKDPRFNNDAKALKQLLWKDYFKIIGTRWTPRMNSPFDPVAARNAKKYGIKVVILKGTDLNNLKNFLKGNKFNGTIIK